MPHPMVAGVAEPDLVHPARRPGHRRQSGLGEEHPRVGIMGSIVTHLCDQGGGDDRADPGEAEEDRRIGVGV